MKFKTKLFLLLTILTMLTNVLLEFLVGFQVQFRRKEAYNFRVLTIATTAAIHINGDELIQWQKTFDKNSPVYQKYQNLLQKIIQSNQQIGVKLAEMIIIFPDTNQQGRLRLGIYATTISNAVYKPGQPYQIAQTRKVPFRVLPLQAVPPMDLKQRNVLPSFVQESWGYGLLAHAPIYDASGKIVAIVAAVLNANEIITQYRLMFLTGLIFCLFTLAIAIIFGYRLAHNISRPLENISSALGLIGKGDFAVRIPVTSGNEFGQVEQAVNEMALALQQRNNLKISLAHYVSNQVAEAIIKTGRLPEVQGERRKITVLFCDIRNFTPLAEDLSPEDVVNLLNTAFEVMVNCIFKYSGMLDKFLGDGFMAIFGAPLEDDRQEEHAIRAAIEIHRSLKVLAEQWQTERGIDFKIGVGINTGIAVVGNIGSKQRMDYTAIGDTVNLAARLESATKEFNNASNIFVSEYTHYAVRDEFEFKSLGSIQVKGRHEPILVYEVLN